MKRVMTFFKTTRHCPIYSGNLILDAKMLSIWRLILGWPVGIASYFLISLMLELLLNKLNIPTFIHAFVYDEINGERDGYATDVGIAVHALSLMFASRIGMAVYTGKINGGVTQKGNLDFWLSATGVFTFAAGSALLFVIFKGFSSEFSHILNFLLSGALLVGCCYVFIYSYGPSSQWRHERLKKSEEKKSTNDFLL